PRPTVARLIGELLEHPGRLPRQRKLGGRLLHLPRNGRLEPVILRQGQHKVDPVILTPLHQLFPTNPESPRRMIFTSGHAWRICFTIRSNSSTHPAEASRFDDRKRAPSSAWPQKIYSGR